MWTLQAPLRHPSKKEPLSCCFANVSQWSALKHHILLQEHAADIVCVCETHLPEAETSSLKNKALLSGVRSYITPVVSSGKSALGTSAGSAFFVKRHLLSEPLPIDLVQAASPNPTALARSCACRLRVKRS